jgi:hypothetical protein
LFLDGSPITATVDDVKTIKVTASGVDFTGTDARGGNDQDTRTVNCNPGFKEESGLFTLQVSMSGDVPEKFALTIPGVS